MNVINLGSSSAGNCFYIELERKDLPPVKLLLEAGFPYQEIVRKATRERITLNDIQAILVTHGHGDHCKAVANFIKRRKAVYANEDVISRFNGDNANVLQHDDVRLIAADTRVMAIDVEHDAPSSLGFVISTSEEKILFVNDCKYFKSDLSNINFDYVFIEANYDGQFLHFAYENAKKEDDLQNIKRYERLFDSHMSMSNCIKHLQKLDLSNCKAVFLMHLSERHANANKFKNEVKNAIKVNTFVCRKDGGIL